MHENSETIQREDGKWINVFGGTTIQIPGTIPYNSMREAVEAAQNRSASKGLFDRIQENRRPRAMPGRTPEERMAYGNRNPFAREPRKSMKWEEDFGDWMLRLQEPGMLDTRNFTDRKKKSHPMPVIPPRG